MQLNKSIDEAIGKHASLAEEMGLLRCPLVSLRIAVLDVNRNKVKCQRQQHDANARRQQVIVSSANQSAAAAGKVDHDAPGGVVGIS